MGYGLAELQQEFALSSEVADKLQVYSEMLIKWQARINLVGSKTLPELWNRHFRDSAQLSAYIKDVLDTRDIWLDMGSGAGFPGLVLAIMRHGRDKTPIQLIESDQRKAIFLREVIRATEAQAIVHNQRIQQLENEDFGGPPTLITARALAPLKEIFDLTQKFYTQNTKYLLLKGQDVARELTLASKYMKIKLTTYPSRTDPSGLVLEITEVTRV